MYGPAGGGDRTSRSISKEKALLVGVTLNKAKHDQRDPLAELDALARSAGADIVGRCTQNRARINPAYYVGKGKAEEIAELAKDRGASVIIFDDDLSPAQVRDLEDLTELKVIDRSILILDIFASRAQSAEAKIQVELAQMQYTYPRLTGMWSHLDTVVGAATSAAGAVGGIGTRGPGEKQLETDRRLVQKRISDLRKKITEIDKRKTRLVQSRRSHFKVSLVGYTNAGKSSLMNHLTDADTLVADKLFATLDTKTSLWNLPKKQSVLLSDTVGFIRKLPHHLVASFRATLEEAIHADLLLHVADVSHHEAESQISTVNKVLQQLGCGRKDSLLLFNKIDLSSARSSLETLTTLFPDALCISARTGEGIDQLGEAVISRLVGETLHLRVACSQGDGRIHNYLRAHGSILSEEYIDSQLILEARLGSNQLPGLKRLGPGSCEVLSPAAP